MSDTAQLPEISCDRCVAPGTCCKSFELSKEFAIGQTPESLKKWLEENNFPFTPLIRSNIYCTSENSHIANSAVHWVEKWRFACTKLGEDGRCTIYEDRPDLCKKYTAGCDTMCIHMRLPNGQPIIPLLPEIPQ